jgi:2-deoxy-scyllo-inosose synthase
MRTLQIGQSEISFLTGDVEMFAEASSALAPDRWLLVSARTPALWPVVADIGRVLAGSAPVRCLDLDDAEWGKSLDSLGRLVTELITHGATRASVVVAVGGGNVSNVAGLAAALLYRGIRLVQIPTTLIGMSDAVLSLKQGVNIAGVKNGLGTFYKPSLVWADSSRLTTLAACEIRAGIAEIIKNALAIAPEQVSVLGEILRPEAVYEVAELDRLIELAVTAKSRVLAADEHECRAALALEYGHTVGHALEILSGGRLGHGYGVALGMRVAARIAFSVGLLPAADVAVHDRLLSAAGFAAELPRELAGVSPSRVVEQVQLDNKRGYLECAQTEVPMVLLRALGQPVVTDDRPLVPVDVAQVADAFALTFDPNRSRG